MAHLGLVGIGVMGSAFAQNLAENGHTVSILDRNLEKMNATAKAADGLSGEVIVCETAEGLVNSLPTPRAILTLVPSGDPLDSVIGTLAPLLSKNDLIADLGNSNYKETERRVDDLEARGLLFLGMGISGGAEGARHGPSIMAGGSKASWARVEGPLKDASAKFEETACCDWFGPGGAGHFIKMLHNGIEYADMQMIAEAYGMMRDGLNMPAAEIGAVFEGWMDGPLNSYLIEIAGSVAKAEDPQTGQAMLDVILDKAGQKGTGRWSVIEALHLGVASGMMSAAVDARNTSGHYEKRQQLQSLYGAAPQVFEALNKSDVVNQLEQALIAAKTCAYVQGFNILAAASDNFNWSLDMGAIARVWRAGCIIRSVFLDEISDVMDNGKETDLALSDVFRKRLQQSEPALRQIVSTAVLHGHPAPALFAALNYHDMRRTGRSTANMIQGLRDYFGAHTFAKIDEPDVKVNGPWHE